MPDEIQRVPARQSRRLPFAELSGYKMRLNYRSRCHAATC
jgi:hypothetical protein